MTGDSTNDAISVVSRKACKTFVEHLDNFFENSEELDKIQKLSENVRELSYENAELEKKVNVYIERSNTLQEKYDEAVKQNDILADKLRNAQTSPNAELSEAKKRAEEAERKLENRSNYLLAKAKEYLKNHSISDEERQDFENLRKSVEDYELLVRSIKQSEQLDNQEYMTRWRILTKDVAKAHKRDKRFALFAKADGRLIFSPWKHLPAFTGDPSGDDYDQEPYTHYMTIPRVTLRDLLGLDDTKEDTQLSEPTNKTLVINTLELCEGCPHHVTDPNNPNFCVLPDCIHNYEKPIGPSSNNTNL